MTDRVSRETLISLVEKLRSHKGTERLNRKWMTIVEDNVPDPGVIDLIYRTNNLSPAEIIDRALAYQPILLGSQPLETSDGSEALFDAVRCGDVARVEQALDAGAHPDQTGVGQLGWRPLHAAIEAIDETGASVELLRVLLDHGAEVDAWDRTMDTTPLLMAVFRSQPESVKLLLARGADAEATSREGHNPIHWAAAAGDVAIVDILLAHGIDDSVELATTREGNTPLGAAAMRGHIEVVERLLTAGADPALIDAKEFTAEELAQEELSHATGDLANRLERVIERLQTVRLFDAVLRGDVAQVEKALADGADPNAEDTGDPGWRPLHAAVEAIDVEGAPTALLRVLLDHGAQVDVWDRRREATPLLMAAFRSQPESVQLLLAHGADPNVASGEGFTPILWAVTEGDDAIVEILLAHGIQDSIDRAGTGEGTSPLGAAAMRGRVDIVERLLAAGADPIATDYDGRTAEERARAELSSATGEVAKQLERIIEQLTP